MSRSEERSSYTRKFFREIKTADDGTCIDCNRKNPQWASGNQHFYLVYMFVLCRSLAVCMG